MTMICSYAQTDAEMLAAHFNDLHPTKQATAHQLDSRLSAWSMTWVIHVDEAPVGYACVAPLPGLPGQYDLDMMIAREWQRQRLGSQLIDFLKCALVGGEVANLSWGVMGSQTGLADFLRHNGFDLDHEEQILARPHLDDLPPPPVRPHLTIKTFSRQETIRLFCRLYEEAFTGHLWYQPYTPDEVAAGLISARDILFLFDGQRPFGFAWLHIDENSEGKVEPIGIIPEGQGRGNGRFLFLTALHQLKQQGASRAIIGTWAANTAAITFYQSLGFSHQQTITYYATKIVKR